MAKRAKKNNINIIARILRLMLVFILLGIVSVAVAFMLLVDTDTWKDFDPNKLTNVSQTLYVYDTNGIEVAGVYNKENRTPVKIDVIPEHVKNAFIAIEDARFYNHFGIDIIRMFGAAWQNIKTLSFSEGFSTISQQLLKNTHLSSEKTINRKVQEMYLTIKLEQEYEKDEILEMYVNYVYFGNGAYGIEAAALSYFNKSVGDLSLSEGAMLAGIIKAPGNYSPHLDLERSVKRRDLVLRQMEEYGFIDEATKLNAQSQQPNLVLSRPNNSEYSQYVDIALEEASKILDMSYENMTASGYKIYTSMDSQLQKYSQDKFQDPELFPDNAEDGTKVEGASVVIDARTGAIKTIVAGRDYAAKGLNRAVDARRQPGSAIKPVLVYAPAIDAQGYNGATLINDHPIDINGYAPHNYSNKYNGWVSLRYALKKSLNIPAVLVLSDIGVKKGIEYAKAVGIPFDDSDDHLPLALGGFKYGVTPLELAAAYQGFANQGYYNEPYTVVSIKDSYGKELYSHKSAPKQTMDDSTAFIMADILQSTVASGTATRASVSGVPIAGKTGTVSYKDGKGVNDAWTVAFTTEDIVIVWNGYDMPSDIHFMPSSATGGVYPAMMVHEILAELYKENQPLYFKQSDEVVNVKLDLLSYEQYNTIALATEYTPDEYAFYEYFTIYNRPTNLSIYWDTPVKVSDLRVSLSEDDLPIISFTPPQDFIQYTIYRKTSDVLDAVLIPITTIGGDIGIISYTDISALPGKYDYTIIPFNPSIYVNDQYLLGTPSDYVSIEVPVIEDPDDGGIKWPWESGDKETPAPSETAGTIVLPTPTPPVSTPTIDVTQEPSPSPTNEAADDDDT